jgi:hypothetical protein
MGTDITLFVEVKLNGAWAPMASPLSEHMQQGRWYWGVPRDYHAFAWLANVRNVCSVPSLTSGRGIPKDASLQVKDVLNHLDFFHSQTHMTLAGLRLLVKRMNKQDERERPIVSDYIKTIEALVKHMDWAGRELNIPDIHFAQ